MHSPIQHITASKALKCTPGNEAFAAEMEKHQDREISTSITHRSGQNSENEAVFKSQISRWETEHTCSTITRFFCPLTFSSSPVTKGLFPPAWPMHRAIPTAASRTNIKLWKPLVPRQSRTSPGSGEGEKEEDWKVDLPHRLSLESGQASNRNRLVHLPRSWPRRGVDSWQRETAASSVSGAMSSSTHAR